MSRIWSTFSLKIVLLRASKYDLGALGLKKKFVLFTSLFGKEKFGLNLSERFVLNRATFLL